jgi:hypothetical protein
MTVDDAVQARMGGPVERMSHGRWSLEVRGDEVADVRFDGVLLLRAVRPVVRDRDWNTVPVAVVGHEPVGGGLVMRLRFSAEDISYEGAVRVRLDDDSLEVGFDGRALADLVRNRIGLVVLHPAADAGRPVQVTHTDGRVTAGTWPTAISPHQPFRDVAGFAWSTDGVAARLALTGEVFETEDQRNWTDASFKTYGTPLSVPFPVTVVAGEALHQGVRLLASGPASGVASARRDQVTVTPDVVGRVPPISLGASLYPPPDRLPPLPPGFATVLVELTGDDGRWPGLLRAAAAQAEALGAGLDVRIVAAESGGAERAVAALAGLPVVRLGVFDPVTHVTTPELWDALRAVRPTGDLVGGTRAHFTELNRRIGEIPADVPALAFSITPQMHATEIPHLVDSLAVQRTVAENALRLAEGRPVVVGPVTLARRFNAVATTAAPDPVTDAERAVDPLQHTDFAAAWTLGSVASLAAAGVAGVCYFEVCGPRGIVATEVATEAATDGVLTPAGRVLVAVAQLRGRPVLRCEAPDDVAALAVATDDGVELLVADLAGRARKLDVDGVAVELDAWSVAATTVRRPT